MLSCSIWFSAPSFWIGGGLESRCVGRVYGADGAVHGTIHATTDPKTRCRKPYAATQYLMLLMMGVCARNMSRQVYTYINKIILLHQFGISNYFVYKLCLLLKDKSVQNITNYVVNTSVTTQYIPSAYSRCLGSINKTITGEDTEMKEM